MAGVGLGYLVCFVTLDDMGDEHIRVGDRERDQAVARLQECHAEGRLTVEELQERIQAALAAKTGGDIDKLFVDLPGGSPQRESQVGTTPSMQETYGLSNLGSPGEGLVSYESSQEPAKNKPWYNQAWVFWGVIILVMTSRGILWPLVPIVTFRDGHCTQALPVPEQTDGPAASPAPAAHVPRARPGDA